LRCAPTTPLLFSGWTAGAIVPASRRAPPAPLCSARVRSGDRAPDGGLCDAGGMAVRPPPGVGGAVSALDVPIGFLPKDNKNTFNIVVSMPEPTPVEEADRFERISQVYCRRNRRLSTTKPGSATQAWRTSAAWSKARPGVPATVWPSFASISPTSTTRRKARSTLSASSGPTSMRSAPRFPVRRWRLWRTRLVHHCAQPCLPSCMARIRKD